MITASVPGSTIEFWKGDFGTAYTARHAVTDDAIEARRALWDDILDRCGGYANGPRSFLEVGANIGLNLRAIDLLTSARLMAVEPNDRARHVLVDDGVVKPGDAWSSIEDAAEPADLAFSSGVLIHIPPAELLSFCRRIHALSRRYIVAIEYFSAEPVEKPYRGHNGKLFLRDFGSFWLENFPDLRPVGCGFSWRPITALDNTTWWAFQKAA